MKLVTSNGKLLEVRDAGAVVYRVRQRDGGPPIKVNGKFLMDDDAARGVLRELLETRMYDGEKA
jgi:hypothetical protein